MKIVFSLLLLLTLFSNAQEKMFKLQTILDKNITAQPKESIIFDKYRDDVLFIVFFGHNCKACLKEIPTLKKLVNKEKYKHLKILAFDIHGYNKEALKKFKKEHKINYPLLTRGDNREFINYIKVKTKWRGTLPFLLVFDKSGEPKLAHSGALSLEQFDKIYNGLNN